MKLSEITDGTTSTLLMSEVIVLMTTSTSWEGPLSDFETSLGGQAFEGWLTPNSPAFDEIARVSPPPEGFNGIPGCTLIGDINEQVLQSFTARSKHPGGVNACMCDGSVHFISNSVDPAVWRAPSTAQGGETISGDY